MDRIYELRREIDRIDREITRLLDKRFEIAEEIGRVKREMGIETYDPEREEQILRRMGKYSGIYREILRYSKERQREVASKDLNKMDYRVGIIGYGRMGRLFAEIFKKFSEQVSVYDIRDDIEPPKNIRRAGDVEELICESDIIMVSTPLNIIHDTLKEVRELMVERKGGGKLLFDIATIKYMVVPGLAKFPKDVDVATVHPMFGPNIESHIDEKIFVMEIQGREEAADKLSHIFKKIGFKVYRTDYMTHDIYMIYTIGLPYLLGYTYGEIINPLGEEVELYGGPSYRMFRDYYRRIAVDGIDFIRHILGHPMGRRIVERLVDIIWYTSGLEDTNP